MYAYIKGEIVDIAEDNVVLECNNIGYNIKVPFSVIQSLPGIGEDVKIYTYTCVREDAFILYGFLTKDDLWIFKKLITVNGIGPKGALGILSAMSADDLRFAIIAGDSKAIAKAPGIGAKSAERIILDLKDKIDLEPMMTKEPVVSTGQLLNSDAKNDGALICLDDIFMPYHNKDNYVFTADKNKWYRVKGNIFDSTNWTQEAQ